MKKKFKVGDYVRWNNKESYVIFKIYYINNENEAFWLSTDDRYFNLDYCTKLNSEQIKVLGLED